MEKKTLKLLSAGLILSMVMTVVGVPVHQADAAVANWQQGVSIRPRSNTDFGSDSFKASIRDVQATGANYVTLIVPWCQTNESSSDIFNCGDTPTDISLRAGIAYVHSLGMNVMLKVHLESNTGAWRAFINAGNRNIWFTQYSTRLNALATLASETGVEGMTIGAELISMATRTSNNDNTQRWQSMIAQVRTRYSGFLTYSANWGAGAFAEEFPNIGFWPQLDYIGISGYFPLSTGEGNPSVESLKASWAGVRDSKIKPMNTQYGKPIIFTEIGYKSISGAHYEPWNHSRGGGYDAEEQRKLYEALFSFWNNESYLQGAHLWDWWSDPAYGGQGNTDYTPQHKPALQTMTTWFSGAGQPTPPPPPPPTSTTTPPTGTSTPPGGPSNSTFSMTGTLTPVSPTVNQPVTISVDASAQGNVSNAIVDIEVRDASDNKIFQKSFDNQSLNSTPKNYQAQWTPTATGNYKVVGGIFNNNWTTNYYW
ncbi:MAG: hypothetical protein M3Q73_03635, partial [bacterium]|nr:hypothetical protein [bacterium]